MGNELVIANGDKRPWEIGISNGAKVEVKSKSLIGEDK